MAAVGSSDSKTTATAKSKDASLTHKLVYRKMTSADLPRVYELESQSYPEDEAASLESLAYRTSNACEFFMVAELPASDEAELTADAKVKSPVRDDRVIVGFVCGTLTKTDALTHDTMFTHVSYSDGGRFLCIHSVVIGSRYRRLGLASAMMHHYMNVWLPAFNSNAPPPAAAGSKPSGLGGVLLICKPNLIGFYTSPAVGCRLDGESTVVHGKEKWYQCSFKFGATNDTNNSADATAAASKK